MRSEFKARSFIEREIALACPHLEEATVSFQENSSTMVSRTGLDSRAVLRLHRIFLDAPEDLLKDIVRCFFSRLDRRRARSVRARLKDYVEIHRGEILRPLSPARLLPPAGRVFDLGEILEQVSGRYFPEVDRVEIAWSRQVLRRLMGKWIQNPEPLPNLVLINRLLDAPQVPGFYLEFLVFHELLHEEIPCQRTGGRWVHHPPDFRARERQFPEYTRARDWERRNIDRLYRNFARSLPRIP
jgi:hypothetical protein